ncbi:glycosyltransferase involved in cell wall biosynthesis [Agromyces flavus]|uniref:Glycosyltransferase involved in cell wall biosynthesis n=1 Tax=Agromyces flavus TaxID=589382 RepID=A0A1H1Z6P9_9MICO|nr:glycosyltransferase family A protein [Agromyces flavus]MCP2366945.1 glycosyltransferase involved in cell wall biosynthesis [Agromyces flavus]GGI46712.1 glycosyl transferase [Agromyces flavus]SDT29192.1 Glycosyltransferase involved in cell wall bisynthesis [Agromyces flavus]
MQSVSVVIPAFNPGSYLADAVESAVSQVPFPLEVLVIDDGSTEPLIVPNHPLVRVIRQENAGVSAARNRGIREARGDLVAFLDADDVWYPGKLAAQIALMRPEIGLCSCNFDVIEPSGTREGWGGHGGHYRQLLRGNSIHTSCAIARRSLLLEVGGFDETLTHSEEWGTWLDIARRSGLDHADGVFVGYRLHDRNASTDYRRMWCGAMKVLWRHRSTDALRGVRRAGQIYGPQAFDAFRSTRRSAHLLWACALSPGFVLRQARRRLPSHKRRADPAARSRGDGAGPVSERKP